MNYRHAYHAGNFSDVFKHVVLARLIEYLKRKDAAFRVIDTHAGIGLYDLASEEAGKTGEWRTGIGRLIGRHFPPQVETLLRPYLDAVDISPGEPTEYPGSPLIERRLLRPQDRLFAIELHPEDAARLKALFAGDIQVRVIELDGWLALGAHLPPKERAIRAPSPEPRLDGCGMTVVNPPYTLEAELKALLPALVEAMSQGPGAGFRIRAVGQ
jgi:23S rRNA (adenine2030-N6)-methyltransferase